MEITEIHIHPFIHWFNSFYPHDFLIYWSDGVVCVLYLILYVESLSLLLRICLLNHARGALFVKKLLRGFLSAVFISSDWHSIGSNITERKHNKEHKVDRVRLMLKLCQDHVQLNPVSQGWGISDIANYQIYLNKLSWECHTRRYKLR